MLIMKTVNKLNTVPPPPPFPPPLPPSANGFSNILVSGWKGTYSITIIERIFAKITVDC